MKTVITILIIIAVLVGGFFVLNSYIYNEKQADPEQTQNEVSVASYKDATYMIEEEYITLTNGFSEIKISDDSESRLITEYFGNEARGDLNGDGLDDVAFILTQDGGGTGIFYYVVVALKISGGYKGTNAVYLGDRIAPQTTEIRDGRVIVNYAERKVGEPMTEQPSVGVSKYLKIIAGELAED